MATPLQSIVDIAHSRWLLLVSYCRVVVDIGVRLEVEADRGKSSLSMGMTNRVKSTRVA